MADQSKTQAVMDVTDVEVAIDWQAKHATKADAPCTGRMVRAGLAILKTDTELARRIANWPGLSLEDAMPLRFAGGFHNLFLTGKAPQLGPVYSGELTDQVQIDAIVSSLAVQYDAQLVPWLDGPPQTNEAGRSASFMAGLLWLSGKVGPRFEMNEIGASAGVNTMMERYFYDLGGVTAGPVDSPMRIVPDWRGDAPPVGNVEITSIRGCDVTPVDLSDPAKALLLKSYVWADATERMGRIDAAITLAAEKAPDLVEMDAGEFVRQILAAPQEQDVARVLYHSVMWQYMPTQTRDMIRDMMEEAGQAATADRPLVWMRCETNRKTFKHELTVRYWPGGEEWVQLSEAHPHGAWVEWQGK